jgi:apolipoprotein N-acyltransferase
VSGEANAWLQIIALTGFYLNCKQTKNQGKYLSKLGFFRPVGFIASVWWLYISIHHFGGLPVVLTIVAILLLCGGLAIYYALTVHLYVKLKKSHATFWHASLFASCWTLAEMARAEFFTGFPWGAIGYAHVDSVLVTFAPWLVCMAWVG